MATGPAAGEVEALIAEGWALAAGDLAAEARLLTAEAFNGASADPATVELVERALTLARRIDDPLIESAALDQLTAIQLARGEVRAAAASALRRIELLAPMQVTATSGLEFFDGFVHGRRLRRRRRRPAGRHGDWPNASRDLPFYREEGHLATARLLVVTALAGDWDETVALAERFREGWERAGRPRAGNLSRGAYAAATVHGLRGDDDARAAWLDIVDALATPGRSLSEIPLRRVLRRLAPAAPRSARAGGAAAGHARRSSSRSGTTACGVPGTPRCGPRRRSSAGHEDAAARIQRARLATAGNPIATAIVDRAAALDGRDGDRDGLTAAAAALEDAGCRYQWARTLVFIGGEQRARGESVLATMGATPMVWPPE